MTRMLALLLIATLFNVSGCGLATFGKLAESEQIPSRDAKPQQPELITEKDDPYKVVEAAHKKLCEVKSYRTRTEMSGPGGLLTVTTAEFVVPDRRRAVQFAGTSSEFETISIGSRTYQRSNGKWSEMKGVLSEVYAVLGQMCSQDLSTQLPKNTSPAEVKRVGTGIVNGRNVILYGSVIKTGNEALTITDSVGVNDGFLYRSESKSTGSNMGDTMTVTTYSDYNADIRIEIPVQ